MALAKIILCKQQKVGEHMRSAISFLAMLVLVSTLIAGCGCLAADSYYAKPAECEKYHTDWPRQHNDPNN